MIRDPSVFSLSAEIAPEWPQYSWGTKLSRNKPEPRGGKVTSKHSLATDALPMSHQISRNEPPYLHQWAAISPPMSHHISVVLHCRVIALFLMSLWWFGVVANRNVANFSTYNVSVVAEALLTHVVALSLIVKRNLFFHAQQWKYYYLLWKKWLVKANNKWAKHFNYQLRKAYGMQYVNQVQH